MTAEARRGVVHVVDDDPAVLHSLCALLGGGGLLTRAYRSASDLLSGADALPEGCVVMDVRMPGMDGAEAQRRLAATRPDMPVILITGDGDVPLAVACLKAGAADFLEKPFEPEALVQSIEAALASRGAARPTGDAAARVALLTDRERDVLRLMVDGGSNKEIARRLGNSHRTIEIHRAHINAKLGAKSLAEVIRIALAAGM